MLYDTPIAVLLLAIAVFFVFFAEKYQTQMVQYKMGTIYEYRQAIGLVLVGGAYYMYAKKPLQSAGYGSSGLPTYNQARSMTTSDY